MRISSPLHLNDETYKILFKNEDLYLVINTNPDVEVQDILLVRITNENMKDKEPSIEVIEDRDLIKNFLSEMIKLGYHLDSKKSK